jgi:hypothetical protein
MVVSAAVRLGWSGRPRRPAMEKGDPSVHHHLFRLNTRQSKPETEDRPDRKRPADGESRLPVHVAPIGMAAGRPPGPASEWPWRLIPPTTADAPVDRAGAEADEASDLSAEEDESEDPTLLPAA